MKLIVGLGNPGKNYHHTRHNIGFRVVDALNNTGKWDMAIKHHAMVSRISDTILVKPQTFMNESGRSVQALLHWYKLTPADVVVVLDDKDMVFGKLRERATGSDGGHRGLRSILQQLGTLNVARLKIGIAPPSDAAVPITNTADFVLDRFTAEEEKQLPDIMQQAGLRLKKYIQ